MLLNFHSLAESGADNNTVEDAINKLYREFKDIRDAIKLLTKKSLDDVEAEVTPGYETAKNEYPDIEKLEANYASIENRYPNMTKLEANLKKYIKIKKLEANLKKRIKEASTISAADAKN